jgi:hypothetical protein
MLAAVTAWRDAVADMIPTLPRGVPESMKISEQWKRHPEKRPE